VGSDLAGTGKLINADVVERDAGGEIQMKFLA
jgi:hypothetical protein